MTWYCLILASNVAEDRHVLLEHVDSSCWKVETSLQIGILDSVNLVIVGLYCYSVLELLDITYDWFWWYIYIFFLIHQLIHNLVTFFFLWYFIFHIFFHCWFWNPSIFASLIFVLKFVIWFMLFVQVINYFFCIYYHNGWWSRSW